MLKSIEWSRDGEIQLLGLFLELIDMRIDSSRRADELKKRENGL